MHAAYVLEITHRGQVLVVRNNPGREPIWAKQLVLFWIRWWVTSPTTTAVRPPAPRFLREPLQAA